MEQVISSLNLVEKLTQYRIQGTVLESDEKQDNDVDDSAHELESSTYRRDGSQISDYTDELNNNTISMDADEDESSNVSRYQLRNLLTRRASTDTQGRFKFKMNFQQRGRVM